jgi:serine O-acetyltransferase
MPELDADQRAAKAAIYADVRSRHPRFVDAVIADARLTAAYLGRRSEFRSQLDAAIQAMILIATTDAFVGQVLYRAKARLQTLGVPVLPWVAHRLAMVLSQVCIGDPVVIEAGIYLPHGQVVIDGLVTIGKGTVVFPWVTIGLLAGNIQGATIESDVHIGTGAKVLGPVRLGEGAQVGANSVVLDDVPVGATVVGAPAKVVGG